MCHERHFEKNSMVNLNEIVIILNESYVPKLIYLYQNHHLMKDEISYQINFYLNNVEKCAEQLVHI